MNILFLILSLLTLFACLETKLLKDSFLLPNERRAYNHYISAKETLHNKWERRKYALHNNQKKQKSAEISQKKSIKSFYSHRKKLPLSSLAKWNLAPLLLATEKDPNLEFGVVSLLTDLYGHTEFWKKAENNQKDLAYTLLLAFYEKHKHTHDFVELSDLFPENPSLQFLFYKMLQGSGSYDIEKKWGHPPLQDFFSLENGNNKTLHFSFASYPALKAFFGTAIAEEILALEKKKASTKNVDHCCLLQAELQSLLTKRGEGVTFYNVENFLHFNTKKVPLEHLSYQEEQGLSLQIPLSHE